MYRYYFFVAIITISVLRFRFVDSKSFDNLASMSLMSGCSHAFGDGSLKEIHPPEARSLLNLSLTSLPDDFNSTIVVLNAGLGTTGTGSIYGANNEKYGEGCHYAKCRFTDMVDVFRSLFDCVKNVNTAPEFACQTEEWLQKIRKALVKYITSGVLFHIQDSPMSMLFGDIIALLPHIRVQHSVRDPYVWVLKRLADHDDVICTPHSNASVSFNILECVQGTRYLKDNLMTISQFTHVSRDQAKMYIAAWSNSDHRTRARLLQQWQAQLPGGEDKLREVAMHYVAYNRFIRANVPRGSEYQPICMWDEPDLKSII